MRPPPSPTWRCGFVAQATLIVPSAGMRALRRALRDGRDLQLLALNAILPLYAGAHATGLGGGGPPSATAQGSFGARARGADGARARREGPAGGFGDERRRGVSELRGQLTWLASAVPGEAELQQAEAEAAARERGGFLGFGLRGPPGEGAGRGRRARPLGEGA